MERIDLEPRLLAAVRRWCEQHGPLGLLLTGVEAFSTWPRYSTADPGVYWQDRVTVYPQARTYELSSGQWRCYASSLEDPTFGRPWQAEEAPLPADTPRQSVERAFQADSLLVKVPLPGYALHRSHQALGGLSSWYLEPMATWWRYFPALALGEDAFDYPEPDTAEFWQRVQLEPDFTCHDLPSPAQPEFWNHYAEPLDFFLREAAAFSAALGGVRRRDEDALAKSVLEPMRQAPARWPGLRHEPDAHEESLRRLLAFVTPDLVPDASDPDRYRARWSSATLLSTLAFMAYRDLTGGARLTACRRCGRLFVARRDDRLYCSPRCKATEKKRCQRHPELLEEALRLHSKGLGVEEIASRLQLGEKRIAAWLRDAESADGLPDSNDARCEQEGEP